MKKEPIETIHIDSITQSHQLMRIDKPKHPLFSIVRFEDIEQQALDSRLRLIFDYYQITLKRDCPGKLQYGQTMYDFDEGVMSFFAPKQVNILEPGEVLARSGWLLNIHPDFLRTYPLAQKIKDYGFFEYAVNEALILSEEEEKSIIAIFHQIEREYTLPIDNFSQDVVISNIELLLTYCNRYYNRQFIVRKATNHTLLGKFEKLLNEYFDNKMTDKGLPSVKYFADAMNISPNYLGDMLRQLTGNNVQQHIHERLINKAKELLSTTDFSVNEIAYELGFEYPQSFSKLFKNKTNLSPSEFRQTFQ
ncbi:helix-turn-helix transcriptional regulator [Cytophagaceae bacterium YF14B1]|uniref:Helix-turn-helix transcriptional regulator n=1 Tax=Xanthocytophaga flava TaxID=3048013 RepID=A0AAE3QR82_9BACT|nr:helix-turn-helix transcriptional regulator [Xanthocytophaga flavus]MDJ1481720.1 helix-turn-helix transcriptional regulator [Xanthocytophaga flavus]